jgi:glycosyltransferase involved in cell wall biosynthesis
MPTGDHANGPRVLMVDNFLPDPLIGGGVPRSAALLAALVDCGCRVRFLPTVDRQEGRERALRRLPGSVTTLRTSDLAMRLAIVGAALDSDGLLLVSRFHNLAKLAPLLRAATNRRARVLFDMEAMPSRRDRARADLFGDADARQASAARTAEEANLLSLVDGVLAVSHGEAIQARELTRAPVFLLQHAVAGRAAAPDFEARCGLLFVGPVHDLTAPNADALQWFATRVWPQVRATLGATVPWRVVGHLPPEFARLLAMAGATVLGTWEDLTSVYDAARLAIAPIRFAAGIPLKVVEAAAHGLPVVATGLLAEQLDWPANEALAVAAVNDPAGFARHCIDLHGNIRRWSELREKAGEHVRSEYSPTRFRANLAAALAALC